MSHIRNLPPNFGMNIRKYLSCHQTSHGFHPFQPQKNHTQKLPSSHRRLPQNRRTGRLLLRTRQASHVRTQLVGGLRPRALGPLSRSLEMGWRNFTPYKYPISYKWRKILHGFNWGWKNLLTWNFCFCYLICFTGSGVQICRDMFFLLLMVPVFFAQNQGMY